MSILFLFLQVSARGASRDAARIQIQRQTEHHLGIGPVVHGSANTPSTATVHYNFTP